MQFITRVLAAAAAAAPFLAQAAPLSTRQSDDIIPGKYIIRLKPDADIATIASHHIKVREIHARNLARRYTEEESGGKEREYSFGGFKGYAGSFDAATITELEAMDEVMIVEPDYIMYTAQVNSTVPDNTNISASLVTQENAPWGLGAISARTRLDQENPVDYIYDSSAGQGTFSYVVDTGIRTTHTDFEGRAIWGFNAVTGTTNTDNEGHGTHVAGTVGGKTYGVAKKTTLVAVKVFEGGQGSTSTVIAGFDWAVNDIVTKGRQNTGVINLSLGGPGSAIWDAAITEAWASGVLSVTAAGNENQLASNRSPGRAPEALNVGNLQSNDVRYPGTYGSNYGPAVDIWAPGTGILSAYATSDNARAALTGSSMASPHVAGLVSYLRALEGFSSAEAIRARVIELATPDRVSDGQGAANLFAYNNNGQR
ncbi:hypothetical protein ACN47E_009257 [Coniothyrium glycines]